ncbi:MAG: formate C-acetyltransferase/glycerol dehydratase family glycyl radical enzyme [Bacteroidetes bacterium 4572_117]|nr:MAG: formate C-acetyltransferase/glycerol dehydratase family glycyl radical enzyme [Bacteroidetes bacterium 4572_117]
MNKRIEKLREKSLNAINKLSVERALLLTEFYKSDIAYEVSSPVRRALSFKYIMKNKKLYIGEYELIIGERGPEPKATPTYPEVSLHSIKDLEILDTRPKVSFKVDEKSKQVYKDIIIPYWKGKNNRDKIMKVMSPEWLDAYYAGIFTEFQEQRAPGHTVAGNKIYGKGMKDIKKDIGDSISKLDYFNDPEAYDKHEELKAMEIVADTIIMYAKRNVEKIHKLATNEPDANRKAELLKIAEVCSNVPENAPQNFHEALQYYWFVHLGVITELNPWDSFNPGRLDQHLYPFYTKGIEDGSLTREQAVELLQAFWIKFNNHPAPPKMGVTALESNTYTDFTLINVGGLKTDGSNAINELSYIVLDVIEEMRLLQPGSMVQVSKKSPEKLLRRTLKIIKTGFGQPSIFNTDTIIQELVRQGKSIEDARNGGASGCIESGAFGTESYILTGYFNLVKILEITLNNGFDKLTGKQIGLKTGNANNFKSMDELMVAYKKQENYFADIKIKGNNIIERLFAKNLPAPFLSLIIDDCITNAKDYNDKYLSKIFDIFYDSINGRPTARGGKFRINLLPTTSHVYFGSVIGALPDGRKAGIPLSEGISPVQGADKQGPTAVLKSAAKIDHIRTGGTLLNQRFAPDFFEGEEAIGKLSSLIRSYFRMDGHHIQFNVVDSNTLRDAQKHPEKHTDLIVRVAGYSDYFNDLGEDLQNEIIHRTEHKNF